MKIELDLPDWVGKDDILMLLHGQELVAFKHPCGDWKVKKVRCNQCGECCLDVEPGHVPFPVEDGKCSMLDTSGEKWFCKAGHKKPFACLGDPLKENSPNCVIEYI